MTQASLGSVPIPTSPDPGLAAPAEAGEQGRLLGLYHGYDLARVELARLVARFGSERPDPARWQRRGRGQAERSGYAEALFPEVPIGCHEGWSEGAHSAVLAAFAAVSDKAEALLAELCRRWPELRQEMGGPLPSEHVAWSEGEGEG